MKTCVVQAYVLYFYNHTQEGKLVFTYAVHPYPVGTFCIQFTRAGLHKSYKQPVEGDRVNLVVELDERGVPQDVKDGSILLVCRAAPIPLANAT